jgi:hypothetical protein
MTVGAVGGGVRVAFKDGAGVVLGLEKPRHHGVLERPQRDGPRLIGGELAQ